ncbi:MAG: hypothetical protein ACLVKA_10025 [Collinsella aerofaciens]
MNSESIAVIILLHEALKIGKVIDTFTASFRRRRSASMIITRRTILRIATEHGATVL